MSNNDSLIDNFSLLSHLGRSDHFTFEVSVNLDYNNADFDGMQKAFNDKFNITLRNFTDVNGQVSYFVKTLILAKESFITRKMF